MVDTINATTAPVQHAPAMKVGGRRLSVTTKHKPSSQADPNASQTETTEDTAPIADYPRPAPPADNTPPLVQQNQHQHQQQHNEEPPKKEKNEKKILGLEARKAEMTRPTRDSFAGKDHHAAGMRISQPSGKAFGV